MKRVVLFFMIVFAFKGNAQKQGNIWYFGVHAGLDFSTGNPVTLNNGQTYSPDGTPVEGSSVICDSSGSLLFYSNGMKVWDKNQQVMPNGDSLLGNFSSSQAALIVPQPGSSRYFYVFTVDDFYEDALKYGFRYSVVDICLNNGLGDVISGQKNILLLDTVTEKLTGVKHANGTDYWIIVHKYFSDAFYSYHLASSGIVNTVITHIGSNHPTGLQNLGGAMGQLKASPNGKKLAIVNGNSNHNIAEYFDFDNSTGVISNWVNLQWDTVYNFYGVSFSPDNSKLYIACILNIAGIFQFDLNEASGNPDSVRASRYQITSAPQNYFGLQLANNGKIYGAHTPNSCNPYLSVINFPNTKGAGCNYVDNYIDLNSHCSGYGFPNFIDSYDYSNTTYNKCATGIEQFANNNEQVNIYPNPNNGSFVIEPSNATKQTLQVYDVNGKMVLTQTINGKTNIDASALNAGVYNISMVSANGILNLNAGVYNISMVSANGILNKRLVIVR